MRCSWLRSRWRRRCITCSSVSCILFFFFQAEDGIRDHCVTGVQTCALPICASQGASGWLVFAGIAADFPQLGGPRVFGPHAYKWPNFLKSENLLNIANQIAEIGRASCRERG